MRIFHHLSPPVWVILGAILTGCQTTSYRPYGYGGSVDAPGRFLLPGVGFRGVAFGLPADPVPSGESEAPRPDDAFLLHLFTGTLMGKEGLNPVLGQPYRFAEGARRWLVVPGFFDERLDWKVGTTTAPIGFAHLPPARIKDFLAFEVLGYARKVMGERQWTYAVVSAGEASSYLRVWGTGGAEETNENPFELRWVLGHSTEFLLVIARGPPGAADELAEDLDAWVASLDYFPQDPARQ